MVKTVLMVYLHTLVKMVTGGLALTTLALKHKAIKAKLALALHLLLIMVKAN